MAESLEATVAKLERCGDPQLRETARELLGGVLTLHERALSRLLALAREADPALVERMAAHAEIGPVLLLHGLHPSGLQARVEGALESVRPQLRAHGGDARLVSVDGGRARLELQGACHGCPSSTQTLKDLIEGAVLGAAPELEGVEVA